MLTAISYSLIPDKGTVAARKTVAILLLVCAVTGAASAGAATTYAQRFVTFFDHGDKNIPERVRKALDRPPSTELPAALRNRRMPLPVDPAAITAVIQAPDGGWWLGSSQGAMRCPVDPEVRCDYFAGRRYLPDDEVRAVFPESARFVWIRTRSGVSRIELRPLTLEEKARHYEEIVRLRHNRYGLLGTSELTRPGDLTSNRMFPNDNDGLWTAIYIGAESFRYAATRDPEARRLARASLDALMRLEEITGIPGLPARAYIRKGDFRHRGGEWHPTADGEFEWKGDTSSDEIVGHYFAYSIYYDLVADAEEKKAIAAVVARITDYILNNDRYLLDVDGQPTTWGRWAREYFQIKPPDGIGWCDAPLNSLELLSFVRVAHHITGRQRYADEYRKLVDEGYAAMTAKYREQRCEINYSDEELAMLSFYPLFEYEKDPGLRKTYLSALDQWWENIQREESPLWIYIYNRATGKRVDLDKAERALARHPADLVSWTVRNSHRRDIRMAQDTDRFEQAQSIDLLPPHERPVMRWNANPFRVDGGNGGRSEDDGAAYLLPYWMGRYFGNIN